MGDLRINPVDITFNALVQQMQRQYAASYSIRVNAEVHAEYQREQYIRNGVVIVSDFVDQNHVFDSDGVFYDYSAWLVSARIRLVEKRGFVNDNELFNQMCADITHRHPYDKKVARWFMILHCLIVRRNEFYRKYGIYPEPLKQWVIDIMRNGEALETD